MGEAHATIQPLKRGLPPTRAMCSQEQTSPWHRVLPGSKESLARASLSLLNRAQWASCQHALRSSHCPCIRLFYELKFGNGNGGGLHVLGIFIPEESGL